MAATLLECAKQDGQTTTANVNAYFPIGGRCVQSNTETQYQITLREAGTLTDLFVLLTANTVNATSTVRTRKNAANGGCTASITANGTGIFEDTSGSDTIAAGDEVNYQWVPGAATGTATFNAVGANYNATTNTVTRLAATFSVTYSTASTSVFLQPSGEMSTNTNDNKARIRNTCTAKSLFANVTSNARTTATTLFLRKNGANGTNTISIGSTQSGLLEDTTHSDSFAAGDDMNYGLTTGTGTQNLIITAIAISIITTSNDGFCTGGRSSGMTISANLTNFFHIMGFVNAPNTTEAQVQRTVREAFSFFGLTTVLTANSVSAASTLTLRKNGADTALVTSITASTTGAFWNSVDSVTSAAGDEVNYELVTGATGTSVSIRQMACWTNLTAGGVNIDRPLSTEALTLGESLGMVRGKARTVSQTLTLGESSSRLAAKKRAPSTQALTLSDAAAKIKGVPRPIAQTLTIGEALTLKRDKIRTRSETLTLGESATRQKAANRSISQTLILSEALTRIKGIPRSIAQTLILGESLARKADKTRTRSESLTLGESAVRKKSAFRSIAQTLVLSDALVKSRTVIRSIAQTLTLGESLTRMTAKTRAISQTLTLGESLSRLKSATRSLSQTLTVTDLAERFRGGVSRSLSELLTVGDSVTRKADKTRSITQTLTLSEALNRSKGIIRAVPTQSLTLGDLVIRLRGRVRVISQTLTLSESLTRQTSKIRAISQTLTLSDNVTRTKSIIRSISETLTLSSQVTKLLAKIRSLAQTLTLGESLARQASKIRAIAQTLTLTDNAAQSKAGTQNIVRAVPTETLTIGDSVTRRKGIIKSIAENLTLGESLNRLAAKKRALATQVLAISDNVARIKTHVIIRTVADTLTVGDSVARRTAKIRAIAESLKVTDVLQGFKNGVEFLAPVIEPPNLIGLRRVIVRKPRYVVRVKEITTIEQSATSNIMIPAFKYQINRASSGITIVEWLQKATARIALRLQLDQSVKASIKLAEQIKQTAFASRIQIPPDFRQISKSKILNPKQQYRFAKLIRLFFMTDKID